MATPLTVQFGATKTNRMVKALAQNSDFVIGAKLDYPAPRFNALFNGFERESTDLHRINADFMANNFMLIIKSKYGDNIEVKFFAGVDAELFGFPADQNFIREFVKFCAD